VISYQETLDGITPEGLTGFFQGWPTPPSAEQHLKIMNGSEAVVIAVDPEASGRVVGFVTAVGDGVLATYVPLLEVLPEYRGRGIASELVRRLFARLDDRYMIDLVCDETLVPFYERLGMARVTAMVIRRPETLERVP
jgi:ribosomal protein S18 acetylase RimI-like enzyme